MTGRWVRRAVLWGLVGAIGMTPSCSDEVADRSDAGDADALAPEEALDAFCAGYREALCARIEACRCGAELVSACQDSASICPPEVVRSEIELGTMTFAADRSEGVLEALESTTDCGSITDLLGWTAGDLLDFGGLLGGTLQTGVGCTLPSPEQPLFSGCERGVCVDGTCLDIRSAGEGCDEETICIFPSLPVSAWADETALTSCPPVGICPTRQGEDGRCENNDWCVEGFCDGNRCSALVPLGGRCFLSTDCETGYCDIGPSECAEPLADGRECRADGDCRSGFCDRPEGQVLGVCRALAAVSGRCAVDQPEGCESGACLDDTCVEAICLATVP